MDLLQTCRKCNSYELEVHPITKYKAVNGALVTIEMVLCLHCDYAFKRRLAL